MSPPRPHLFARSSFSEAGSRFIARGWKRGWFDKPPLDPEYLWREGSKGFGGEDEVSCRSAEDVDDFRVRLDHLCNALTGEARLNALGHFMAYGQLVGAVRNRHALGRLWRAEPEIARTPIAPPILVLGQMRSGTTRVQRLLAADPQFSGTRLCNSMDPVPANPDFRPLKAQLALLMARRVNPWLDTFHPMGATRTDEEIGWLAAAFSPAAFEAQWRIPSFVAFNEQRDQGPVYREFARILRSDAAASGTAGKARILKCPQYAEDAAALFRVFPEARVIRSRRDAGAVHASSVSMVASQMAFQTDHHSREELETEWRRKMALREKRLDAALAGFSGPVTELSFDDLNEDPIAAMREAYRALGLVFDRGSQQGMEGELARAADGAHHKHKQHLGELLPSGGR